MANAMTVDEMVEDLNRYALEREYRIPFHYDVRGKWVLGGIELHADGRGELNLGLVHERGVDPSQFDDLAQCEAIFSTADGTTELGRSSFRVVTVGVNPPLHLLIAEFTIDVPDDLELYRCQIQKKTQTTI